MTPRQIDNLKLAAVGAGYKVLHTLDYGLVIDTDDVLVNDIWNPYRNMTQLYCLARACGMVLDFGSKQVRLGCMTFSWNDGTSEADTIISAAGSRNNTAMVVHLEMVLYVGRNELGYYVSENGFAQRFHTMEFSDANTMTPCPEISDTVSIVTLSKGKYILLDGPLCLKPFKIGEIRAVVCKLEVTS